MARTDLLTRLQQLFRDFQAAELSGQSVIDIQNQRLHPTSTRRDFLKTAGVTGAIAALEGPARLLAGPQPRIAIVGGGIAGLNGALTLQDAGYACTIYEASGRIGGRMHSDDIMGKRPSH
jgi:monoamine oxidase